MGDTLEYLELKTPPAVGQRLRVAKFSRQTPKGPGVSGTLGVICAREFVKWA